MKLHKTKLALPPSDGISRREGFPVFGPYPLNFVSSVVQPHTVGVYILSRDGRQAEYTGRSDSDLASRIWHSASVGSGYRHFWFDYASSPRQAYQYECTLFHHYRPPDNTIHPAIPAGTWWRCPVPTCPWG